MLYLFDIVAVKVFFSRLGFLDSPVRSDSDLCGNVLIDKSESIYRIFLDSLNQVKLRLLFLFAVQK